MRAPSIDPNPALTGPAALELMSAARDQDGATTLVYIAGDQTTAAHLLELVRILDPLLSAMLLPEWDCLPYDRVPPTSAAMGARMAVFGSLLDPATRPALIITSASALIHRVPPRSIWGDLRSDVSVGNHIDLEAFQQALERSGYRIDDRVDEPGEYARHGKVIDVFPGNERTPVRIEHAEGKILAMKHYDPASQRSQQDIDRIVIWPASEVVPIDGAQPDPRISYERLLLQRHGALETFADYAPGAAYVVEDAQSYERALRRVSEAHTDEAEHLPSETLPAPDRVYLEPGEWEAMISRGRVVQIPAEGALPGPKFHGDRRPAKALAAYIAASVEAGDRVVLAGAEAPLAQLTRRVGRAGGIHIAEVLTWNDIAAAAPGAVLSVPLAIEAGFRMANERVTFIAVTDVVRETVTEQGNSATFSLNSDLRRGDTVVHMARGLAVLDGLETVKTALDSPSDVVRLRYGGDEVLLVPIDEISSIWRYGSDSDGVHLDRLKGNKWDERRAQAEAEIAATAKRLAEAAEQRRTSEAATLVPPAAEYEAFVASFPYAPTPDQATAISEALHDMASGHPMARLVCGDVGYGKTEVALRAAAAAVLSGKQVAVVAPTTVLARQHAVTFARRFARIGVKVAQLSRLSTAAELRAVKQGLVDGSIRLVVGTHALAGAGVQFKELGLVVIDEEQRFGAAQKERLRTLGESVHMLVMSATPIPRTLQAGLAGLVDLSVIATAPSLRQPVRTNVGEFNREQVRGALLREAARGGQSFIVCPRIEDIEPMAERLVTLAPELSVSVAHGKLPADELDRIMVEFADGTGDVLLATNIIESGLDIPRANTMIVWRPDRFGLAQLHQLRGRVGRGNRRATAFLMTDPEAKLTPAAEKRLRTLEALDRVGAGFAISESDLDARGGGDLFGIEQAGHVKLIGIDLYRHLLSKALTQQRGAPANDLLPQINLGMPGRIPEDYVVDADVRLNLYRKLSQVADEQAVTAFEEEVVDRFGPAPEPVIALIEAAGLRILCKRLGITRLDGGANGVALTFAAEHPRALEQQPHLKFKDGRLILSSPSETFAERIVIARNLIETVADILDPISKSA